MCGIWASWALPVGPRALELAAHRGPDGPSWREVPSRWGPITMGHAALRIQAPAASPRQPLCSDDERWWLTFNGEILNAPELRARLGVRGVDRGDAEMLLEVLRRRGLDGLCELRGFFAFVAFDRLEGRLHCARDRFGVKPLYLHVAPGGVGCASEIKQFLAVDGFRARVDRDALADYLDLGLFDHGRRTMFAGVEQVRPGEVVSFDLDGGVPRARRRQWYVPHAESERDGGTAWGAGDADGPRREAGLRERLGDATRLYCRAGVPWAVALSGGIDSATVASFAAEGPRALPLRVFTVSFDGPDIAEEAAARATARRLEAHHTVHTLADDELEPLLDRVIWHLDEPVLFPNLFAQWALYASFRQAGCPVALTGQGGDEILAGYPFLLACSVLAAARSRGVGAAVAQARRIVGGAAVAPGELLRGMAAALAPAAVLDTLLDGGRQGARLGWVGRALDFPLARARSPRALASAPVPRPSAWGAQPILLSLLAATNIPMLLHFEDRMSAAHGIEARPVLLDHPLVEFALGLPDEDRSGDGVGKSILRRAMRGRLPESTVAQPRKLGFPVPERRWMSGPLRQRLCREALASVERFPDAVARLMAPGEVRRRVAAGDPSRLPIWRLASLGIWGRLFDVQG